MSIDGALSVVVTNGITEYIVYCPYCGVAPRSMYDSHICGYFKKEVDFNPSTEKEQQP